MDNHYVIYCRLNIIIINVRVEFKIINICIMLNTENISLVLFVTRPNVSVFFDIFANFSKIHEYPKKKKVLNYDNIIKVRFLS